MWILIYFYLFAFSFIISLILTPVFRAVALKLKILDVPSSRKVHISAKPLLGGLAFFFSFFLTVVLGLVLLKFLENSPNIRLLVPQTVIVNLPSLQREIHKIFPLFWGGALVILIGLFDDIKGMNAYIKLFSTAIIGVIMVFLGVRITLFMPNPLFGGTLTVLWCVFLMNSFNLMDNMDGLACGVALVAAVIFFGITSFQEQVFTSSILIIFIGALAGFLIFNWHPSSIFMGDAGSMWLGFMLASLTIMSTFYSEGRPTLLPVIMPLLILGVPLFDTISVILIRLARRKPLFVGDKNHFSHRLVQLGMTQPQAVAFIYLVTFCIGINSTLLFKVGRLGATVILVQAVVIFIIIALLEHIGRRTIGPR